MHARLLTLFAVCCSSLGLAADPSFEGGEKAFAAVKKELLEHYVKPVTEEELYRAAVEGMLARMDPSVHDGNMLVTPAEFADLNVEMKGEVVGIGAMFDFDDASGRATIKSVIPGSPAEKGDLRAGDLILTVDGASFRGKHIRDLVTAIRGKAGDKVTLAVLRDAAVLTRTLERQRVAFDVVTAEMLPGNIGLLTINTFAETTPAATKQALTKLAGARALIVDLRDNEGGLLEKAIEAAKLLIPKGATITRLVSRGGKEEPRVNTDAPALGPLPTVVLVNSGTRSSAELVASALRDGLHAPLVGQKTFGKWSVQSLKALPNGYVMRYTVALFRAPDGQSFEGVGLTPDIQVEATSKARDTDAQLRAAMNTLSLQGH